MEPSPAGSMLRLTSPAQHLAGSRSSPPSTFLALRRHTRLGRSPPSTAPAPWPDSSRLSRRQLADAVQVDEESSSSSSPATADTPHVSPATSGSHRTSPHSHRGPLLPPAVCGGCSGDPNSPPHFAWVLYLVRRSAHLVIHLCNYCSQLLFAAGFLFF